MRSALRYHQRTVVAVAVLAFAAAIVGNAGPQKTAQPVAVGPIPVTAISYPFSAADHQKVPFDLSAHGYIEQEFMLRGRAKVYEWPHGGRPHAVAEGPYVTRILIRRPRDMRRFNGTAIVEPLNPSAGIDLPIMWAESHRQLIADGYAWVGITIKPNTIKALKAFDPVRYAEVTMPNPRPEAACAPSAIAPAAQPTTPTDETGLAWDMIGGLGRLLKSSSADNPLGRPAARLYMTGQSQSAGYARTYATMFGAAERDGHGHPLYDGYLYSGSPPWQVPVNQCAKDPPPGDPRLLTGPAAAPVIELFTQGDMKTNVPTRRPDSDRAPDLFRRYEITGGGHLDPWEQRSFAAAADMVRAGGHFDPEGSGCTPAGVTPTDFPNRYAFDAAWRALDRWARLGQPAPHAAPMRLVRGAATLEPDRQFVLDAAGNPLGGVRSPYVEVPTARWVGAKTGSFSCLFYGYKFPFDHARLRRMYGTHANYVARVRASASNLVRQRWLTPEDAAEVIRQAQAAEVP